LTTGYRVKFIIVIPVQMGIQKNATIKDNAMGAWKVILFWAVLSFPVGLALGAALVFAGRPLYYRIRHVPRSERLMTWKRTCGLVLMCGCAFTLLICGLNFYDMFSDADDYRKSKGGWRFWRLPLGEPYELRMVDAMEQGSIAAWKQADVIVADILEYDKQGSIIAGMTRGQGALGNEWFLFDCTTGQVKRPKTFAELEQESRSAGFSRPLHMETVRTHWYRDWKIVTR